MSDHTLISSDRGTGRVAAPKKSGFYYNWGPQQGLDRHVDVQHHAGEEGHAHRQPYLLELHPAPVRRQGAGRPRLRTDQVAPGGHRYFCYTPLREKWRKRYGNFVREVEWALLELRKHYNQKQYEEIVIGTSVALSHETSGDFLKMMNSMSDKNKNKKAKPTKDGSPSKPGRWSTFLFETFNPAHWLTVPGQHYRIRSGQRHHRHGNSGLRLAHLRPAGPLPRTPTPCPRRAVSISAKVPLRRCSTARAAD